MPDKLIYEKESYAIRGAIFEVYREKGCGFLVNFGHYPQVTIERIVR